MAQVATMGPPLSPRETRRSGRRSAPSVSASASKSPDSDQPSRDKATSSRVPPSSAGNRTKRLKQEDYEESVDDRKFNSAAPSASSSSAGSSANGNNNKPKKKTNTKEQDKAVSETPAGDPDPSAPDDAPPEAVDEEEEQGITRCVCGSTEDDPDAGEFMVQCETCKVWQHGLCMGYQSEDQVHDDDYYCELCRPELHAELLKKLAKKPRQVSAASKHDTNSNPRISRSHSPAHLLKQPSKRRNTMNSRDAAFDESLKEIIEATAAEAAAVQEANVDPVSVVHQPEANDASKKKRKRSEDDINPKKRTRSASTASDHQSNAPSVDQVPPPEKAAPPVSKPSAAKNKRGSRKVTTTETAESDEIGGAAGKRPGNSGRSRNSATHKRPALGQSNSHGSGANVHEHGTRRNHVASGQQASAAEARAYRNSHAYAVSQQTLFTSWNLPDYLSHLEPMLPTETPQPLEVRASGAGITPGSRGGSLERTMERGVKVRWPAKRMSVGDMNKRVRALVEWVGREQVSLEDRKRRREALEAVLREQAAAAREELSVSGGNDVPMVLDGDARSKAPTTNEPPIRNSIESHPHLMSESALEMSAQTMKMMEELMEELIGFQERFGPGAKGRDRERRMAAS